MLLLEEFKTKHGINSQYNDMIEHEDKEYQFLEILEYDLFAECLTEYNPNLNEKDNQLYQISNCTDYFYSYYDFLIKEYIMQKYLLKLRKAIDKMNKIDIQVRCNTFTQTQNVASVTFNNIDQKSIYSTDNDTIINWNICDAQKTSFEYMYNPLICLLGISEFTGVTCSNLPAVKYDMLALRRLFEGLYGFKVIQENDHMFWNHQEIKQFFDDCITNVLKCKGWHGQDPYNKLPQLTRDDPLNGLFDGIIVIISTHGGQDVIYDSFEQPYKLHDIYEQFGSHHPALINIPRLFVVDACRGNDTMMENMNNTKAQKQQLSDNDEKEFTKTHKGSNRATLFGNSPGIATAYDFKDDSTNGCSYFIKSIIKTFTQYEKQKHLLFTPSLSEIIFDIKINLSKLTTLQIPYKNGDVKLDKFKILKKKILHPYDNPYKIYDLDAGDIHIHEFQKYNRVFVRGYKNVLDADKPIILDSSGILMKELFGDNNLNIEEQFPKRCAIKNIEIIPNTNNEIVYTAYPTTADDDIDYDQQPLRVKLHSIVCVIGKKFEDLRGNYSTKAIEEYEEILRQNQYGSIQNAQKHRFIKIEIINNCNKYELKMCDDSYFDECKFMEYPNNKIFNQGGKQIFYIIGQKLDSNDPFCYNEMCESGINCVLKYQIIDMQNNNGNKFLIVAIRSSEQSNKLKDLPKPMYNCWICDNKLVEQQHLKIFLNRFNDNVNNYKNRCYLQLLNDDSCWKLTVTVDIDASNIEKYDNLCPILLIYGYLRSNELLHKISNEIIKCICKYFSVNNVYASGRDLCGQLCIGKTPILDVFTMICSLSSLIGLQSNFNANWLRLNGNESFIETQNGELYVTDRDSGMCKLFAESFGSNITYLSDGFAADHTLFIFNKCMYGLGLNNKAQICDSRKRMFGSPELLYNIETIFNKTKIKQIKCGETHTLVLCENGQLWAAGDNRHGQCGSDHNINKINKIALIKKLSHVNIIKIDVGRSHNLCLDVNGKVWCFGANAWGQCGFKWKERNNEVLIQMGANYIVEPMINNNIKEDIIDVKCSRLHSLCLTKSNQVYLFGKNTCGEIGNGCLEITSRVKIPYLHKNIKVKDASLGWRHTVLLPMHGDFLYTFGYNEFHQCSSQLDEIIINTPYILTKKEIGLPENNYIQHVVAGNDHTVIVVEESLLSQHNNMYL